MSPPEGRKATSPRLNCLLGFSTPTLSWVKRETMAGWRVTLLSKGRLLSTALTVSGARWRKSEMVPWLLPLTEASTSTFDTEPATGAACEDNLAPHREGALNGLLRLSEKDLTGHLSGRSRPRGLLMPSSKTVRKVKQPSMAEFEVRIGPPKLTRFERARIVGARSLQIAMGAPAFVPIEEPYKGPIAVAMGELEADALPISIRRSLPNGITQDIPIRALAK